MSQTWSRWPQKHNGVPQLLRNDRRGFSTSLAEKTHASAHPSCFTVLHVQSSVTVYREQ